MASKLEKKVAKWEKELIEKYGLAKVKTYKRKYDEAHDLLMAGSDEEDKHGLESAQKKFYDEAEKLLDDLPQDYKEFRELLSELW